MIVSAGDDCVHFDSKLGKLVDVYWRYSKSKDAFAMAIVSASHYSMRKASTAGSTGRPVFCCLDGESLRFCPSADSDGEIVMRYRPPDGYQ